MPPQWTQFPVEAPSLHPGVDTAYVTKVFENGQTGPFHYEWVHSTPLSPFSQARSGISLLEFLPPNNDPNPQYIPACPDFPYYSSCWASLSNDLYVFGLGDKYTPAAPAIGFPLSSRLGINLLAAPSPGDLLCPAATVAESSLCLLPPGAGGTPTGWQGATRPTLSGVVDLVTGMPLAQVTDLELPIDGATFRLTRTRSASHSVENHGRSALLRGFSGTDRWWDWVGSGWMASENPILLIDSGMPDTSGPGPRTTWLWIDAHHSIPFQQVPSVVESTPTVEYEAPPRFRARMTHNGIWTVPSTGAAHWATPPTQYDVWLYDGLVHYTFVAIWEDVPPNRWRSSLVPTNPPEPPYSWSSYHDRPIYKSDVVSSGSGNPSVLGGFSQEGNPGLGVPHYGLCVQVQDQNGHSVEIGYCGVPRLSIDDSSTPEAVECIQDGQAKGQIKYIKLKSGDQTRWTLVYAHRRFPGLSIPGGLGAIPYLAQDYPDSESGRPELWELHGYNAIDRIYVFQGDIAEERLNTSPLTIHDRTLPPLTGGTGTDPLTHHNTHLASGELPLPYGWVHQVQYFYDSAIVMPGHPEGSTLCASTPPVLLKTTVRTRKPGKSTSTSARDDDESVKNTVFVYADPMRRKDPINPGVAGDSNSSLPWLRMIFTDADIERLRAANDWVGMGSLDNVDMPSKLASWGTNEGLSDEHDRIKFFASVRWEPCETNTWLKDFYPPGDPRDPSVQSLLTNPPGSRHYLMPDAGELWNDGCPSESASVVVVGSMGSEQRYYRLHHLIVPPDASSQTGPYCETAGGACDGARVAWRSAYLHPYLWQTDIEDPNANNPSSRTSPPDLTKSRFIRVIDEFPMEAPEDSLRLGDTTLYNEPGINYELTGAKPGQMSRRVVEMNASGFVLRDRKWEFGAGGTLVSGGGLGEEYFYQSGFDLFHELNPTNAPLSSLPLSVRTLGYEMVLTQHRSVGWSAADLDQGITGVGAGLIHFTTYKLVEDNTQAVGKRIEPWTAGVQRGTGAPPQVQPARWTEGRRIVAFDESSNDSTETTFQLRFSQPVAVGQAETLIAPALTASGLLDLKDGTYYNAAATVSIVKRTKDTDPNDPTQPLRERRVLERTVIGTPRQQRPGGVWYFPVEKEWYDDKGNVTWSATGLVNDPFNPANSDNLSSLIFTWYKRYASEDANTFARNQTHHTVVDADASASITAQDGDSFTVGAWPEVNWSRHAAVPARNSTTSYSYGWFGLQDVYFPTGKRWAKRVLTFPKSFLVPDDYEDPEMLEGLPRYIAREYILNDLEAVSGGFVTNSVGEVIDHSSMTPDSPMIKRRVEFTNTFALNFANVDDSNAPAFTRLAAARMGFDSAGRARQADLLQYIPGTGWYPLGYKQVNDLGEVYRERDLDGTITRITRNSLGQDLRKYVGTSDEGWVSGGTGTYNMALIERNEHGVGVTNAWLPTATYHYDSNPTWHNHYYEQPGTDEPSSKTETSYDWRMRPVCHDSYVRVGSIRDRESTTLTYLDHMDRPRFTATIGKGTVDWLTGVLDPTTLGTNAAHVAEDLPSAASFFAHSNVPGVAQLTSLSETIYAPDGSVTEQRTYDVQWTTSSQNPNPTYQAEFHFRGQAGQEVFTRRPGEGVHISKMDGLGRVISSALVAPGQSTGSDPYAYELSRTDYIYDRNGNVVDTRSFERVDPNGDALSATTGTVNAVRTRTVSWFDSNKRLIATADLGTQQAGGYVAGGAPFDRFIEGQTPSQDTDAIAPTLDISSNGANVTVTRPQNLPGDAPLYIYKFDKQGNQTHSAEVRGNDRPIVTISEYSNLGRLSKKTENALDTDPTKRRSTEYDYHLGRIVQINASRANTDKEVTKVDYHAVIVNADFAEVSASNALIGKMWMPEPDTGLPPDPATQGFITLKYNFQGQIAERIDARGVVFRYAYDDAQRLKQVLVGSYSSGGTGGTFVPMAYPASMTPSSGIPLDRLVKVDYSYDQNGRLYDIKSYTSGTPPRLVTHNRYESNQRGNLTADWQSQGAEITSGSPRTLYTWEFTGTGTGGQYALGQTRLASMTYPAHGTLTARVINLGYGQSSSIEEKLSRLTGLTTNLAPTGYPTNLAKFGLSGSGRRVSLDLAAGKVRQNQHLGTESSPGYGALDSYGRLLDMHAKNAAGYTLFRSQYTYDIAGNRTTAKLTQAPTTSTQDNVKSQHNDYDNLDRLIGTQVGSLNSSGTITPASLLQTDTWNLDLLGNWTGSLTAAGRVTVTPSGTTNFGYDVDQRNRMTALTGGASNSNRTGVRYDASGNLQFDGTYFYQYDAWNRLIQVNAAAWQTSGGGQNSGTILIGNLIKNYAFDGLGRLARTLSPYPNPAAAGGFNRTERFYYDGIRRIQEVITDPVSSSKQADESGDANLQQLADQTTPVGGDTQGTSIGLEVGQLTSSGPAQITQWLDREYVWGPGDGPGGIDELLVQYDNQRRPWWVIQDEGGDIAALCDLGAANADGRVVSQFTYDAYGSPLSYDNLFPSNLIPTPLMRCGHKGLFVDRLDVGVVLAGGVENARITPGASLLCHNRNRTYSPKLGRFLQQDPNASGSALLEVAAYHGRGYSALVSAFSLFGVHHDGAGLYQYLGSSPWSRRDPCGLSWDPFSMVDEINADRAASAAALLNQLSATAMALVQIAKSISEFLPIPFLGFAADLAEALLNGDDMNQFIMDHALGALLGAVPGGSFLMNLGGFALSFIEANTDHSGEVVDEDEGGAEDEGGPAMAGGQPAYMTSTGSTHHVYVLVDKRTRRIVYTGISTDPKSREIQHKCLQEKLEMHQVTSERVSERNARGMESAIMTKHPRTKSLSIHRQFQSHPVKKNRRLSVGRHHKFANSLISTGGQWLKDNASWVFSEFK